MKSDIARPHNTSLEQANKIDRPITLVRRI